MMMNPGNQHMDKILELLEETGVFTPDEMAKAEDYISGNGDMSVITGMPLRDMSTLRADTVSKANKLISELLRRERDEEADKLSEVLFAAGGTSVYKVFPWNVCSESSHILTSDPAKKVAVKAAQIGTSQWMMTGHVFSSLTELAGKNADVLRRAVEYQYKMPAGKLVALTAYFWLKYPDVKNPAAQEQKDGLLAGLSKALGRRSSGAEVTVQPDAADAPLMRIYEDILIDSLPNLYGGRLPKDQMDKILDAVRNDSVDGSILAMAKVPSVSTELLRILAGMAFVNYVLSPRLKNVLMICAASAPATTLVNMNQMDMRGDLKAGGEGLDEMLAIDSDLYIKWAAGVKHRQILRIQFKRHKEAYMECMEKADFDTYNIMASVVREVDPGLHKQQREKEISRQQDKVIAEMVQAVDAAAHNAVESFLRGEEGMESFCTWEGKIVYQGSRWGGRHWRMLEGYEKIYGYDAFCTRCEAMLMVCRGYQYSGYLIDGGNLAEGDVGKRFAKVNSLGVPLRIQLNAYADMYDSFYADKWKQSYMASAQPVFRKYLEERRDEMTAAIQSAGSTGRNFGLSLLAEKPEEYKQIILGFSQDSSKAVREALLDILYERKEWEKDVLGLLSSKKAAEREIAVRVLVKWDGTAYAPALTQALEKEKNGKVRTLLETVLHIEGSGNSKSSTVTGEDMVKELHKGNKKRSLAWAYETPFSKVHTKQGEEVSEEYLQAILLCYSTMSPCGVSVTGATLAASLDEKELAIYVNELFDKWMEAGAESKKRWVLYAASIHGGADIIGKLHHQIQEWPLAARGAIASEAVQALSLNPLPQALLIVDGISRKFKFKQIKAAAGKALDFAASQLGITTEELADRIVPDLGFDENMERFFDYGERRFKVTITPALEIEVFDEGGKKLKNLPAPGKRDDGEKAEAAYEEFKQMKKQMKATVSSQKMRLEMALSTGRQWKVNAWKDLFVKNPIMHQFAMGLIWGVYEDGKLAASFRYMEDGSFNTEDEDEFELPECGDASSVIGLVHPIELSEDSRKVWKEQLEDYEITQPIGQLDRPVYYRTKEEEGQKSLERFGGCIVNDLSLGGKLQTLGWYRGSVQDAGGFYSYYREDPELSMGVELHFSGSFVGGQDEDVTVYEARFYSTGGTVTDADGTVRAGGIRRGSYVYDEADDSNSCFLKDVPERYFSEIVLQLSKATASSKERIENWKNKR